MAFGASEAARLRAETVLLLIGLGLSAVACGGDGDGEKAPVERGCEPSAEDVLAEALAFERELVIRGRADTGYDQAFGEESERLIDEADARRTELIEQAASELGLELPDPSAVSVCPSEAGVAREPLSVGTQLGFGLAVRALEDAARRAPIEGAEASIPYTSRASDGVATMNITTSGHDSTVNVTVTINSTVMGEAGSTTESAYVAGSIDVCPDPGGISHGDVVIVLDGNVGEPASYHAETNQAFDIVVNDDAVATSTEMRSSFQYRATGGPREADVEAHASGDSPGESGLVNVSDVVIDHTDGSAESQRMVERNLLSYGHSAATLVRPEAQSKWRGGTCIKVVPDPESEMVDADAALEITAVPKQKFDMSNVDATVVATLSGVKSLDKQGLKVPAPATYHYVAGSEYMDQGVIKFKSTSKRGIGEGTATITVKCDEDMPCPEGKTLNVDECECQCTEVMDCPDGQMWDEEECKCVCEEETCASGKRWDTDVCECVCDRECPPGQALNDAICMCEATCEIDPILGNTMPEECEWVGSIDVTMEDSGSADLSTMTEERTVTWMTSYEASFTVEDQGGVGGPGQIFLNGSIGGSWSYVDETIFPPSPDVCTLTSTQTATVSVETDGNGDAYGYIVPTGDGSFSLSIGLLPELEFYGTATVTDTCGEGTSEDFAKTVAGYMGTGSASRDAFAGSSDTEYPSFEFPDGHFAIFDVSWNLHLVRR
jgi:hypothetical protein